MVSLATGLQSPALSELLTQEIGYLTQRLDAIIREQAGLRVFDRFDRIRRLSIHTRNNSNLKGQRLRRAIINRLSVREAYQIAHALSLFFQLTNLCEERARIRHLREHRAPPMSPGRRSCSAGSCWRISRCWHSRSSGATPVSIRSTTSRSASWRDGEAPARRSEPKRFAGCWR